MRKRVQKPHEMFLGWKTVAFPMVSTIADHFCGVVSSTCDRVWKIATHLGVLPDGGDIYDGIVTLQFCYYC